MNQSECPMNRVAATLLGELYGQYVTKRSTPVLKFKMVAQQ